MYKLIVHKLPKDIPYINIYPIGDKHIGSKECDLDLLEKQVKEILSDPYGYVVFVGDIIDNGLKNSKTNVYEQTMRPKEQKETADEIYRPLKDRVLCGTPGNHCERSERECDINPLYDLFARWGIEDRYDNECAFLKVSLGTHPKKKNSQNAYMGAVIHGTSTNKQKAWCYTVDGADFIINGHTHVPSTQAMGKIVIDPYNEVIIQKGFRHIVVDSGLNYGGYGIKKQYLPSPPPVKQILTLYGDKKSMEYTEGEW